MKLKFVNLKFFSVFFALMIVNSCAPTVVIGKPAPLNEKSKASPYLVEVHFVSENSNSWDASFEMFINERFESAAFDIWNFKGYDEDIKISSFLNHCGLNRSSGTDYYRIEFNRSYYIPSTTILAHDKIFVNVFQNRDYDVSTIHVHVDSNSKADFILDLLNLLAIKYKVVKKNAQQGWVTLSGENVFPGASDPSIDLDDLLSPDENPCS